MRPDRRSKSDVSRSASHTILHIHHLGASRCYSLIHQATKEVRGHNERTSSSRHQLLGQVRHSHGRCNRGNEIFLLSTDREIGIFVIRFRFKKGAVAAGEEVMNVCGARHANGEAAEWRTAATIASSSKGAVRGAILRSIIPQRPQAGQSNHLGLIGYVRLTKAGEGKGEGGKKRAVEGDRGARPPASGSGRRGHRISSTFFNISI